MKKLLSIICILVLFGCASTQNNQPTADVSFKFRTNDDYTLDTFWRKRNLDGSKGDLITVGRSKFALAMNMPSNSYSVEHKDLTAGDYYLVKFEVNNGGNVITTNNSIWSAEGWDENGNPLFLKFTVKEGISEMELPETTAYLKADNILNIKFEDVNKEFTLGKYVKVIK